MQAWGSKVPGFQGSKVPEFQGSGGQVNSVKLTNPSVLLRA